MLLKEERDGEIRDFADEIVRPDSTAYDVPAGDLSSQVAALHLVSWNFPLVTAIFLIA